VKLAFREVCPMALAHLVEKNELLLLIGVVGTTHIEVCAHSKDPSSGILTSASEVLREANLQIYLDDSSRPIVLICLWF